MVTLDIGLIWKGKNEVTVLFEKKMGMQSKCAILNDP